MGSDNLCFSGPPPEGADAATARSEADDLDKDDEARKALEVPTAEKEKEDTKKKGGQS